MSFINLAAMPETDPRKADQIHNLMIHEHLSYEQARKKVNEPKKASAKKPDTEVPEDGRDSEDKEEFEAFQQHKEDYTHPDNKNSSSFIDFKSAGWVTMTPQNQPKWQEKAKATKEQKKKDPMGTNSFLEGLKISNPARYEEVMKKMPKQAQTGWTTYERDENGQKKPVKTNQAPVKDAKSFVNIVKIAANHYEDAVQELTNLVRNSGLEQNVKYRLATFLEQQLNSIKNWAAIDFTVEFPMELRQMFDDVPPSYENSVNINLYEQNTSAWPYALIPVQMALEKALGTPEGLQTLTAKVKQMFPEDVGEGENL